MKNRKIISLFIISIFLITSISSFASSNKTDKEFNNESSLNLTTEELSSFYFL